MTRREENFNPIYNFGIAVDYFQVHAFQDIRIIAMVNGMRIVEKVDFRLLDVYCCVCAENVIFTMVVVKMSVNYNVDLFRFPANPVPRRPQIA